MSLYHIVFLFLIAGALAEHIKKKTPKVLFVSAYVILTLMLCLRFGQGTDYFNYASIYRFLPADPIAAMDASNHSEPGWKFICATFKMLGVSYPVFIFILSLGLMLLFLRFLSRFGGNRKLLLLVLFYHTLYLSYFMSILRQGLVIAVFLGVLLPWLLERKYVRYCMLSVLLITIHTVSAILLLLPLVLLIRFRLWHLVCLVAVGFLAGIVLSVMDIGLLLSQIIPNVYLAETDISILAVGERIVTFGVITFCYYLHLQGEEPASRDSLHNIFKIYAVGIFLYGLLMWSALIASRTVYVLKVVELVLFAACILRSKKAALIVFAYCLLLSGMLYIKNIHSYLQQGDYENANVLNYPYVTIFNEKDILHYRSDIQGYIFKKDDG